MGKENRNSKMKVLPLSSDGFIKIIVLIAHLFGGDCKQLALYAVLQEVTVLQVRPLKLSFKRINIFINI